MLQLNPWLSMKELVLIDYILIYLCSRALPKTLLSVSPSHPLHKETHPTLPDHTSIFSQKGQLLIATHFSLDQRPILKQRLYHYVSISKSLTSAEHSQSFPSPPPTTYMRPSITSHVWEDRGVDMLASCFQRLPPSSPSSRHSTVSSRFS